MKLSPTVWTTEKVNSVLEQIDTIGKVPKDTPFHEGDVNFRKPNISWGYTSEELKEIAVSSKDILYFGENFARVMTDDGIMTVKLRPYQRKCLVQFDKYRKNILLSSRQSGKCVDGLTHVNVCRDGKILKIPIFELHFGNKHKMSVIDWLIYLLYKLLYRLA